MSPRLFNIHMYGVVRKVNVILLDRDLSLIKAADRVKINQLLFVDDTVLVANPEEKLSAGERVDMNMYKEEIE